MQTTLASTFTVGGAGLHTGAQARVTLRPARAGTGVVFHRTDVAGPHATVPALWDRVAVSPLATRIVNGAGVSVSTIEHLMAALAGTGVHNVRVDIDGPEVPILDGSAAPWVAGILAVGVRTLGAPLLAWEVREAVEVRDGAASARLEPAARPEMAFAIDFADAAIGHQEKALELSNGAFVRELCDSRTFCRRADIDAMRARGLALGGTYLNAVVVDGARVLSPGGLRHPDEAVRHKMLDALGDLYTAGRPILGRYVGERAGHALTNRLLRAAFTRPGALVPVACDADLAARLPGCGLSQADLASLPAVA